MKHNNLLKSVCLCAHSSIKLFTCSFLLVILTGQLYSQRKDFCTAPSFAPAVSYLSGGDGFPSIATGDFNKDGRQDLAVANSNSSTIGVLLSTGSSFAPVVSYPSGGKTPYFLIAADFNADHQVDLAVSNADSKSIGVLLGDGNGNFAPPVHTIHLLNNISSLTAGDFNEDGHLDLAVMHEYYSHDVEALLISIGILSGKGDGRFAQTSTYPTEEAVTGFTTINTGDFNKDGRLDLVFMIESSFGVNGLIHTMRGNGDGTLGPLQTFLTGGSNNSSFTVGDFNNDGSLDLVVVNRTPNNFALLLGSDNGIFAQPVTFPNSTASFSIIAADFNGDGNLDLALPNDLMEEINVRSGDGQGSFAPPIIFPGGGTYYSIITSGDFNGDEKLDLAVTDAFVPNIDVLLSNCVSTELPVFYRDADSDGYGNPHDSKMASSPPQGYVADNTDCDDTRSSVYPGAPELCDGLDNDCNGTIDDVVLTITSLTLINATTNKEVTQLTDGEVIDLSALPNATLNIRANTSPAAVGSVLFELKGPRTHLQTENLLPYALFGDDLKGRYYGTDLPPGDYTLTATPYCGTKGTGTKGTPLTLRFKVIYAAVVPSFTLVNAETDQDIGELKEGAVIDLATLPPGTTLNIRANTVPGKVGSVDFALGGTQTRQHTENIAPYALFVNDKQNYFPWSPQVGNYTLTATPRSNTGGSGAEGTPLTIRFSIIYSATVSSFTLVNATTNKDIGELKNDNVIDLATLPPGTKLNIRANTAPDTVGSVVFTLQGAQGHAQAENILPYALFGDDVKGKYHGVSLPSGGYVLTATPFSNTAGKGATGIPLTVHFTLKQTGGPGCTTPNFAPVVISVNDYTDPVKILNADFNKDGHLDLAVLTGVAVDVFLGNGNGSFGTRTTFELSGYSYLSLSMAAADFNNDGHLDLATSSYDPSSIEILLGKGDGSFESPLAYTGVGKDPRLLNTGDFNNDQKPDLAFISRKGIEIWTSNGDGSFASPVIIEDDDFFALATGDFNNDGKLDLAYANYLGGGGVKLGDGQGGFGPSINFSGELQAQNLMVTRDFNNDGYLDVAIGSTYDTKTGVLLGKGDGSFSAMRTYTNSIYHSLALAAGDINLDGKEDLIVTNTGGNVAVMFADGDGRFAPPVSYFLGDVYPSALTTGDFNKDGKLDLATANGGLDDHAYISILLNTCDTDISSVATRASQKTRTDVPERTIPRLSALPNPFSYQTTIRFSIEKNDYAILGIYNINGAEVKRLYQGPMEAEREYRTTFESKSLPAGVYLIRLASGKQVTTSKLALVR